MIAQDLVGVKPWWRRQRDTRSEEDVACGDRRRVAAPIGNEQDHAAVLPNPVCRLRLSVVPQYCRQVEAADGS